MSHKSVSRTPRVSSQVVLDLKEAESQKKDTNTQQVDAGERISLEAFLIAKNIHRSQVSGFKVFGRSLPDLTIQTWHKVYGDFLGTKF